ncbi:ATP-binding protein [Streptomyces sp. NPDC127190]|uniref:ATP-binding protein n=1 Tax=unclassified Streptomyces TaxID=2593676 RepID=UPI0036297686
MANRDADDARRATGADAEDGARGGPRSERRIDIAGDAGGPVVAGDHNVVIDAQHGSTVTLLMEGERPRPVRRDRVALLPRRQAVPLGRDSELTRLAAAVRDGGPVQLWGAPGVGKSTLLRHAARTLTPERDGVLFLDAARREPEDLAQDMFEACYEARGYAPSSPELRRLMTGLRITVYVDNAEFSAEGLRTLMDAAPDATFVVAGRDRTLLGDGTALRLDGLGRPAALDLLARELGRPVTAGPEQHTAADLWETASGRPLLLLRAAALTRLDPSGTTALPRPGEVGDLLPLLLGRLDAPPLRVLRLLATLDDATLDAGHIGALGDITDTPELCGRLVALGLAEQTERGYRAVPDVVPALRERHPEPFSFELLCEHFATWIARPSTTAAQVEQHARALEVVAELAEEAGRADLAVRIVRAASPALARSLRFGVWGRLLDRGLPAARQAGDQQAVAYFTHEQGIRSLLTGRRVMAAVLLAEAAVLWRQLGDLHGAHAAAGAQQYVPAHAGGTPGPVPHTDGGAQALGSSGPGPDPASAHAAGAHGAGAHGAAAPGAGPSAPSAPSAPSGPSAGPGAGTHQAGAHQAGAHHAAAQQTGLHQAGAGKAAAAKAGAAKAGAAKAGGAAAHSAAAAHASASAATGAAGTGAAGAGASAAAGAAGVSAGAGASAAGLAALMKVIAVIVAVVIAGTAIHQARASHDGGSEQTPTGLAGFWRGSDGATYEFKEAGSGSYTSSGQDACGTQSTTTFTGSGGTYSAQRPIYDTSGGSCGSLLGEATTTITLMGEDSAKATTTMTSSYQEGVQCFSCGTLFLTREQ